MTCISNNKIAAVAGALLALGAASAVVAQQAAGGDRYARTLGDADITARYNVQIQQQLGSQQNEIAALEAQIAGLDATAVDVQALLQRMFDELAAKSLLALLSELPLLVAQPLHGLTELAELNLLLRGGRATQQQRA